MAKKQNASEETAPRFESRYNPTRLRECITEGLTAPVIMERMEIRNMQTLRKHLMRLMAEDKVFYDVPGLLRASTLPRVNPKGRLVLNLRGLSIDGRQVQDGDVFQVNTEDDRIVLTRA